jgi:hypothetical protein
MPDVSVSFSTLGFAGQTFQPLPCGTLFWPDERLLLAADLHLEKGSSLAQDGWLLPPYDSIETLERLLRARAETGATRIALLGDSFHDRAGPTRLPPLARDRLAALADAATLHWIAGNHDGDSPGSLPGAVCPALTIQGIRLVHEVSSAGGSPEIGGHWHPKVVVALRTGRRVRRRCFALTADRLVLPAYGAYAGGLDVDDPAIAQALGAEPDAIVPLMSGLIQLTPAARRAPALFRAA